MKNCNPKFKILFLLVFSLIFIPSCFNQTEAASDTLSKTVEFFVGQDGNVRTDGAQFSFYFNNVIIPEASPIVKSAIVEINGVSYNDIGTQIVNADLKQGTGAAGAGVDYILGGSGGKPKPFTLKYDASAVINPAVSDYTLYLTGASAAGVRAFSLFTAKLIVTYNSSAIGQDFLKTSQFFISQEKNVVTADTEISKDFSITISEQNPEAKSVFVEVSGVAKGSGAQTIQLSVAKQGLPVYNTYNLDLSSLNANSKFIARYDMSALVDPNDFFETKTNNYKLSVKNSFDAYLLAAKAIVTYKYSKSIGSLPAKGELISSTFDTWDAIIAEGAAYNSLMWKGNLNGGSVGQVSLQLAVSDSPLGPWTASAFKGPDCTSNSKYFADADTPMPIEIACAADYNNKRYFRYKVIICSSLNCATQGSVNPIVTGVVVNWAP